MQGTLILTLQKCRMRLLRKHGTDWWKKKGQEVVDGLLGGLKDAWTGLTSWFSGVWDNLFGNRKVSVDINRGGNFGSGSSGSFGGGRMSMRSIPDISNFNIPALAQGAVIPPNREFMAILGDQKSGTNIEAPLDTIVEAFNRANRESGGNAQVVALLQALLSAVKAGQTMEVDRRQFGRVVREVYNEESRRVGVNFAGG